MGTRLLAAARSKAVVIGSLAAVMALTILALTAPAARGGVFTSSQAPCTTVFTHPFLPWLDPMNYFLAPEGSLETATRWTLSGGAKLVEGNEPWKVNASTDHRSLLLPSGSSATTRPMCITIDSPTVRFFALNTGSLLSTLKVEVLYEDQQGRVRSSLIGVLPAGSRWQPTLPLTFSLSQLVPWLLTGKTTAVAFRFTPQGMKSGWQIDDVYVDPFRSR